MTRVIAGTVGGLRLRAPTGQRTRPTGDRVKEAMFSTLGDLGGRVVLDLFAGTGGLGIEALSRGADRAVFVDRDRRAVDAITENLARTGLSDHAVVVPSTASVFAGLPAGGPFDLILMDPPYDADLSALEELLRTLIDSGAVAAGATIVLERASRTDEPAPGLLSHLQDRTYGETVLRYFTYTGGDR